MATGIGVTLAAVATIGLGAGAATAAPQQPFAADDPIPGMPGAGNAVNIANSLFGSLSGLMNNVFPGTGDLLMPAGSLMQGWWRRRTARWLGGGLPGGAGGLPDLSGGLPGGASRWPARRTSRSDPRPGRLPRRTARPNPGLGGYPGGLPGQTPGYPGGLPGQTPGGLPGQQLPGQAPGLARYPGSTVPGARSAGAGPAAHRCGSGGAGAGPAGRPVGSGRSGRCDRRHAGARCRWSSR